MSGALPDLDMFFQHRKTLHRPVHFGFLAVISAFIFLITASPAFLTLLVLFGSMNLHVLTEILGQGKTMNSKLKKDDRCVYNHLKGEWIEPMRTVKVGSLRDFSLAVLVSIPLFITGNTLFISVAVAVLLTGLVQFLLTGWITENLLSDYDRFSEAIQNKIGYGPEVE